MLSIYGGKRKRTRAGKCGNDSKGRTIKFDSSKQTNCLMYNSDISPVTQRRVWSATNHRKWQSGLRWYNKQVQITLMNIRERGVAGRGAVLSIRWEKDSSEWAKSIKYSSSHFCTLSSTNDEWSLKGTLAGGRGGGGRQKATGDRPPSPATTVRLLPPARWERAEGLLLRGASDACTLERRWRRAAIRRAPGQSYLAKPRGGAEVEKGWAKAA